jgi:hypothetical protein
MRPIGDLTGLCTYLTDKRLFPHDCKEGKDAEKTCQVWKEKGKPNHDAI